MRPDPVVSVAELQAALEEGRPLTVLDVRAARDRAEWYIPGSIHVDVHDALWARDPRALADLPLPPDRPVVTVCNRGRTSLLAVRVLAARGIEARSLEGGMKAWSVAWNVAPVPLRKSEKSGTRVLQIRRTGKGCLSYLVGSGDRGGAAVIDPSVEPKVYLGLARERRWTITAVLDTHVHADHLSRAGGLARETGATLYLPDQKRVKFPFTPIREGDEVPVGQARLRALHTPGHTFESTCYLLDEEAIFTGDTLFLTSVGRPDLKASDPTETRARAEALHTSLRRLLTLDPETVVLPCHTSEPVAFDGTALSATLADVRRDAAMLGLDAASFVETILTRIPETPPHHLEIVGLNEAGTLPDGDPTDLEAGANRCAIV